MERARGEGYVYQKIEFLLMYTCGYKSYCVRKGQRVITLALFHEILLAISIRVSNEAMPPTVTNKHQHGYDILFVWYATCTHRTVEYVVRSYDYSLHLPTLGGLSSVPFPAHR